MKLFGQLVRTAVNLAVLPVAIVADVARAPVQVMTDDASRVGSLTKDQLRKLKDEAGEDGFISERALAVTLTVVLLVIAFAILAFGFYVTRDQG